MIGESVELGWDGLGVGARYFVTIPDSELGVHHSGTLHDAAPLFTNYMYQRAEKH